MTGFIGPLPEGWQAFSWLYFAYMELLSRVQRLGTVDSKGHNVHAKDSLGHIVNNPRIIEYFRSTSLHTGDENASWCSAFVNWCVSQAGITGTRSAMARSWLHWHSGERLSSRHISIGAIAVFPRPPSATNGHVAMVWNIRPDGSYDVLGGNQGAQHADPKHHRPGIASHVSITHRPKLGALGYLWPKGLPKPDVAAATASIREASLAVPSDLRPLDWHIQAG
jgi:uncharacterized protein (TIGR02594 family)